MPAAWYALEVFEGNEFKAEDALTDKGAKPFVPANAYQKRAHRRSKAMLEAKNPLLPGYVFVELEGQKGFRTIKAEKLVRQVLGEVGDRHKPAPIPQKQMDSLRRALAGKMLEPAHGLRVGAAVDMEVGPFRGFPAVITALQKRSAELEVRVYGKPVKIRAPIDTLKLIG